MSESRTPLAERLVAALGLLLLAGIIATLLYEALTEPERPLPRIGLTLESTTRSGDGWIALIVVRNSGESGAVDITVEGELAGPEALPEVRGTSLAELPPHAVRRIGLHFTHEPRRDALRLRVVGFTMP